MRGPLSGKNSTGPDPSLTLKKGGWGADRKGSLGPAGPVGAGPGSAYPGDDLDDA